ncbi:hypothetical protein Cob_v000237 [Colletotrichum orbiculare MAFF 240422]|uniref:Uncharacterized protein n=1 Tax=Colletotrichum orbiculare (strain 104-T / ATCC 96160 / CBS 514.97 / LARS 414 / MAFF 240422) TaxID=1213857 RepID=A0A484G8U3_COLOR|nr:hypothetical protein Cob_v000237 [Colletotrichum orbiculare MAFF 240422]
MPTANLRSVPWARTPERLAPFARLEAQLPRYLHGSVRGPRPNASVVGRERKIKSATAGLRGSPAASVDESRKKVVVVEVQSSAGEGGAVCLWMDCTSRCMLFRRGDQRPPTSPDQRTFPES